MGTIDSMKSVLTQSALDAFCEKLHIPDVVHPELPGRNDRIRKVMLVKSVFIAEMDLFAFINHADPTKVQIRERDVAEGEVPLLQLTRGRIVPLAGVDDQGNVNVQGDGNDDVNEEGSDAAEANQTEQGDHVFHVGGIDIVVDDEAHAIVADKPKRIRKKRKAADGAGGSGLPPKKLREDHDAFGIGASIGGKSAAALKSLLEGSTLLVEVGVTSVATLTYVTSFVSLTLEREGGGHTDFVTGPNLRTQRATKMFVVLSKSSHHSSTSAADDKVTSVIRAGTEPVPRSIFRDSASTGEANQDTAEILRQTYIPKWNVTNESAFDDPDICRSVTDHLAHPDKCAMQVGWLNERVVEIASLKAQLSLKEAEAADAIRLGGQIATVEAVEATRASELEGLKEQNAILEGQVAALESVALSCDEFSIKASSLEFEKDILVDQVFKLEGTCFELCDEVSGYKLFKEQVEAVQNKQAKALSGHVAGAIGHAIDKGMHDGLAASIDHGKAKRGLVDVAARNPSAKANYVFAINAPRSVDSSLLAQLESQKDASIADIMDLLYLEGPTAETLKASQLQPSPEQLMLLIHRLEDQVVIGETSLSFSLDVAHARVQRIRGDAAARRISLADAMVPLIEHMSIKNLIGEASTFGVPSAAATTTLSTTFIQDSTVPPIPATDPKILNVGPSTKVSSSRAIVFEKETLETTLEHGASDYV
nr:hypothetical protein [Tanacetum cinerariifolium]